MPLTPHFTLCTTFHRACGSITTLPVADETRARTELAELVQTHSVKAYADRFELIASRVTRASKTDYDKVEMFIKGLKSRELQKLLGVELERENTYEPDLKRYATMAVKLDEVLRRHGNPQRKSEKASGMSAGHHKSSKCDKCGRFHAPNAPCPSPITHTSGSGERHAGGRGSGRNNRPAGRGAGKGGERGRLNSAVASEQSNA